MTALHDYNAAVDFARLTLLHDQRGRHFVTSGCAVKLAKVLNASLLFEGVLELFAGSQNW